MSSFVWPLSVGEEALQIDDGFGLEAAGKALAAAVDLIPHGRDAETHVEALVQRLGGQPLELPPLYGPIQDGAQRATAVVGEPNLNAVVVGPSPRVSLIDWVPTNPA